MVSQLIVNADDLGYTDGINRAVIALHAAGALSSATAMATGRALPEAVRSLSSPSNGERSLGVGCHVVFVDGTPAGPAKSAASLLGRAVADQPARTFRPKLTTFIADLLRGRILPSDLQAEAVAQIRALQSLGIQVTHVDTHKHTHLFPRVLRPLLRAALECGVTAVRNPFEPAWARAATIPAPLVRRLEVQALAVYQSSFLREVKEAGMRTTAGALGVLATGSLDAPALGRLLAALAQHGRNGETYELVCHPGFDDAELARLPTRLCAERETERQALLARIPGWTASHLSHRLATFVDIGPAI